MFTLATNCGANWYDGGGGGDDSPEYTAASLCRASATFTGIGPTDAAIAAAEAGWKVDAAMLSGELREDRCPEHSSGTGEVDFGYGVFPIDAREAASA